MSFNKLCPFYDLLKPVLSSCADVKQILNSDDVDHYSNSNNDNDDDDNGDEDEDEDESAAGNDGQIRHTHTHTHTHTLWRLFPTATGQIRVFISQDIKRRRHQRRGISSFDCER